MLRTTLIAALLSMVLGVGCGGGSNSNANSPDPPNPADSVTVSPSGIGQVWQGTTVQFTAHVTGQSNQAVTWSVREGNSGGTIDRSGLYTAPNAAGTFHVVATSQADPKASGSANVEVVAIIVQVSPNPETLRIGGQRQFNGFALAKDPSVSWSVAEGAEGGNITVDGFYDAPKSPGLFHVVGSSVYNPQVSTTVPVTITSTGFESIDHMLVARVGHSATLLVDGRVLVAGGTADPTHSAELFDKTSDTFTATSHQMNFVRSGHCAALLPNGQVLIAGGGDANGNLFSTAEIYDPTTEKFTVTGDLNQARANATATLLQDGTILIAGGEGSQGELASAEIYNPATGSFSLTGPMQSARGEHTATLLANGEVLLLGGHKDRADAEVFDPVTGSFVVTGSLIQSRTHHTATLLLDGKVLILGGIQIRPPDGGGAPPAPVSLDSAELYDPATGAFNNAGKLLLARDSHSATLLANGSVLVAGGYVQDFDGDAEPELYTIFSSELIASNPFSSTLASSLESVHAEHIATLLANGEVLVTGGNVGAGCCGQEPRKTPLATAELYK